MTPDLAIWLIAMNRAERIATPGKWKVWREDGRVRFEVLK